MRPISGFVLTGGGSSRMGADKALLALAGEPLAVRTARRVMEAAGSVALLGDPARYAHLGFEVVPDVHPGGGPLSGIHAALACHRARWSLVVACDLPFLTVEFLRYLAGIATGSNPLASGQDTGPQLVVPTTPAGYELAIALRDDALPAVEDCLARRQFKLSMLYEQLRCRRVSADEYHNFDPHGILFENVNTPEDLARAQSRTAEWGRETAEW